MRSAGRACAYVKKLALRRVGEDIEAFVSLSLEKSASFLGRELWTGQWVRAQETRHADKWRAVVEDRSYEIVLPAESLLSDDEVASLAQEEGLTLITRENNSCG